MAVDKSGERVRRMFGEIARRYDLMNHLLSAGIDIRWRNKAVALSHAPVGGRILDVCTGTGDLALTYWKAGDGATEVIGTDFTHEMLTLANAKRDREFQRSPAAEHRPLTFLEADTLHTPFDDSTFDVVSVAFGLRNVSDTAAGLHEMIRVCKPGGRVVILEFGMPRGLAGQAYRFYFKQILPRLGQVLARNDQSAYNYLPASVVEFPSGQALADLMEQCGLETVTWTPMTGGIAVVYVGTKPAAIPATEKD